MGYLKDSKCYLSAPIEGDDGPNWRPIVKDALSKQFGIDVFDPFADPKQQKSAELVAAKEAEHYDEVARIVKAFVRKDLSEVDENHFLIAYLPYRVPTTGVVHEIINANDRKKPVILMCPKGKKFIPSWYFGFVPHNRMFGSWQDLYNYLQEVDSGKHMEDDRWAKVYKLI